MTGYDKTLGWAPGCDCGFPAAADVVLDPFGGAGTTAVVAQRLGRRATLIELNPEYAEIARLRLQAEEDALLKELLS